MFAGDTLLLPQLSTQNDDIKGGKLTESTLGHHQPLSSHLSIKARTIATFCSCYFDSAPINTVATITIIAVAMILVAGPIYDEIELGAYTVTVTTFVN
jgi:hypothetical protein